MGLARGSRQYLGVRAILPPDLQTADRNPTSNDRAYVKGTLWLNLAAPAAFMWPGTGNWISLGSSSTGSVDTLTGTTGGAIVPVAGNINILGTANQLSFAGTSGTLTASLSSTLVAPGTIASTTTITSGTALIATTSVTAGTTVTATLGAITATNGNLVLGTAGNKIIIATGANASVGTSAAMTAGAVTVATTASSATAKVFYARATTGGTTGDVSITAQDGTGFTLTSSSNTETSTFNWWIINA